jgi:WYL domain
MAEKEVASIPVVGFDDVKVIAEDDTIAVSIRGMFDKGDRTEVILYKNEAYGLIAALYRGVTAINQWEAEYEAKAQEPAPGVQGDPSPGDPEDLDQLLAGEYGGDLVEDTADYDDVIEVTTAPPPGVFDTQVEVSPLLPVSVTDIPDLEGLVESYIEAEVPFLIEYTREDGEEIVRVVSPYEIEAIKDGSPFNPPKYVRGWDHHRDAIRTFRLARIQAIGPARQEFIGSMTNPS